MNKCEVIIKIEKHNGESFLENFQMPCKRYADYKVTSKACSDCSFYCCEFHSNLFDQEYWDFRRV